MPGSTSYKVPELDEIDAGPFKGCLLHIISIIGSPSFAIPPKSDPPDVIVHSARRQLCNVLESCISDSRCAMDFCSQYVLPCTCILLLRRPP